MFRRRSKASLRFEAAADHLLLPVLPGFFFLDFFRFAGVLFFLGMVVPRTFSGRRLQAGVMMRGWWRERCRRHRRYLSFPVQAFAGDFIMNIRDIMSQPVELVSPEDTVMTAARKMAELDCGILPVGENDRLVGVITDRDIVTRAVANGVDPDECYVREAMSTDVKYCYEDESLDDLARNMRMLQIKRLPVLNRQKRLVGIVSLADLALAGDTAPYAQQALSGISQPASTTHH
jgi:CBS domain-containing protein